MLVMKFGGTSVATPENIERVMDVVTAARARGARAVVVSAFGGATDTLINLCHLAENRDPSWRQELAAFEERHRAAVMQLTPVPLLEDTRSGVERMLADLRDALQGIHLVREVSARSHDYVVAFGERLSAYIISSAMRRHMQDVAYLDARTLIVTDGQHGRGIVDQMETESRVRAHFDKHDALQITTGFIASSHEGKTTTLGRGGSDYTASLLGAALKAEEIQIWTDVSGVLTADPRKVKNAFPMEGVSYVEAMELSHFGAKVIYPPTMIPAMRAGVPIRIKNTFVPNDVGTLIDHRGADNPFHARGITSIGAVTLLQLKGSGLVGVAGVSKRLFGALADSNVNVILISQASSEHSICLAVAPEEANRARTAISSAFEYEMSQGRVDEISVEPGHAIVAVVGEKMADQPGVSGRIFASMGRAGVNVAAIAQGSSELNVSFVIRREDVNAALNVLHDAFFNQRPTTHIYLIGVGLIGKELLEQLAGAGSRLEETGLELRLCGAANSRHMILDSTGIDPTHVNELLDASEMPTDIGAILADARRHPNCVLVDCTAGADVAARYAEALRQGVSVVTPNKIANTGAYTQWRELRRLSERPRVNFFYEANVGAALPVIKSVQQLIDSGDKVHRIDAVLSGTLSYLFNSFTEGVSFSELLRGAKEKGYTEPDPRDDLSGTDVARKILILARECGHALEPEDVTVESLVPDDCAEAPDVEAFFAALKAHDAAFESKRAEAAAEGKRLRYVAHFAEGKAVVGLQAVGPEHPCFGIDGSDNIVSITTRRYHDRPLVVRGPGAGAGVTASQVFAEIIEAARRARLTEIGYHV